MTQNLKFSTNTLLSAVVSSFLTAWQFATGREWWGAAFAVLTIALIAEGLWRARGRNA